VEEESAAHSVLEEVAASHFSAQVLSSPGEEFLPSCSNLDADYILKGYLPTYNPTFRLSRMEVFQTRK